MALSANEIAWLDLKLAVATYDIRRTTPEMLIHEMREALKDIPGYEDLEIEFEPNGHQLLKIGGKVLEVGPAASNAEIILALKNTLVRTENTKVITVTGSPINRLKDKLSKASGVAQRIATGIEAKADELIAAEDTLKAKTTEAFAPHEAILAEAKSELQAIEDALNLMSNGGPALDPLPGAANTAPGSN